MKPWFIFLANDTKPYTFEGTFVIINKAQSVTSESVKKRNIIACLDKMDVIQ